MKYFELLQKYLLRSNNANHPLTSSQREELRESRKVNKISYQQHLFALKDLAWSPDDYEVSLIDIVANILYRYIIYYILYDSYHTIYIH